MNKTAVIISLFLVCLSWSATAQQYKTVELKPITQQGWKYYYDLKKVSGPSALEVPLLSVNDEEVERYLKGYKSWHSAGNFVLLVPFVYVLSLPRNSYHDPNTFWWIFGGTLAAQLGLEAIANVKLGKSVDRYNLVIMRPTGSLNSVGASVTITF